MEHRLDDIDRQLLRLLHMNARASTAHLARQMDLARTTVVARIARLEQEGVIAGYGVRLGTRMEQSAVRAYCGIRVQPKMAPSVMQALNRLVEVEEVSAVSGQYDYMVFLRCESNEKLDALLDRIGMIDGIQQTYTSVVLSRKIDRRSTAPVGIDM
jgi:DNA-binding Lrp family transcriptional regulator